MTHLTNWSSFQNEKLLVKNSSLSVRLGKMNNILNFAIIWKTVQIARSVKAFDQYLTGPCFEPSNGLSKILLWNRDLLHTIIRSWIPFQLVCVNSVIHISIRDHNTHVHNGSFDLSFTVQDILMCCCVVGNLAGQSSTLISYNLVAKVATLRDTIKPICQLAKNILRFYR